MSLRVEDRASDVAQEFLDREAAILDQANDAAYMKDLLGSTARE